MSQDLSHPVGKDAESYETLRKTLIIKHPAVRGAWVVVGWRGDVGVQSLAEAVGAPHSEQKLAVDERGAPHSGQAGAGSSAGFAGGAACAGEVSCASEAACAGGAVCPACLNIAASFAA